MKCFGNLDSHRNYLQHSFHCKLFHAPKARGLTGYEHIMKEKLSAVSKNSLEEFFSVVRLSSRLDHLSTTEVLTNSAALAYFADIRPWLEGLREEGGYINPWSISGLGRNEVRTTYTLASLWRYEFAGAASRQFLSFWLGSEIPVMSEAEWRTILFNGYSVTTEVSPLGDASDRVDMIVETSSHIIGIEVKIDAPQGKEQLIRYQSALTILGNSTKRDSYVAFLSNRPANQPNVHNANWRSIATAARRAAENNHTFQAQLIKQFGDYVHNNLT